MHVSPTALVAAIIPILTIHRRQRVPSCQQVFASAGVSILRHVLHIPAVQTERRHRRAHDHAPLAWMAGVTTEAPKRSELPPAALGGAEAIATRSLHRGWRGCRRPSLRCWCGRRRPVMTPHPLRDHLVGSYRGSMQCLDPMGPPGTPVHTHVSESGLRPS